ncbi:T9SS type A sorting domain-containing protein [Hymenobacter properus]|uniref:T9SS type A sorting domain-containing protein n=1 Tax=Hymenobacter properus TaxID=2791026 RepID=A0A931BCX4_9BACT|nr:T9SS type A sorting domain-containing protein [Hymenobacter properus]MBF9141545.1 T9SS type A sorting domain-containing protein [Hymenobacter properus]MBR7720354.1 T9SS type A sorting domain-containing protein [Microvirga sp. SRT04]
MKQRLLTKALALGGLLANLSFGSQAWAEGSKNLTPGTNTDALTATTNDRTGFLVHDSDVASGGIDVSYGFLKPASWTSTAAGSSFSPDQRLYIRLLPGEKLSYGVNRTAPLTSLTGAAAAYQDLMITLRYGTGDGTIVDQKTLTRASTTTNTYQLLTTQAGVINSYAQATAGPGGANGYVPLTYVNNTGATQDFFVEFTQVGEYTSQGTQGAFNDLKTRSNNTAFPGQRYSVYDKWDFTVTGTDNLEKTGRLFSKFWAFSTGPSVNAPGGTTFENRLSKNFTLYPLVESRATPGQYYVKAIELAGLRPYAFFFVTNEFGSTTATGRNTVALRRRSQTSNLAYAQYPSFVNDPDRTIWPSAAVPVASITPQPYCRSGNTEVAFTTYSSETGRFDINITYGGNTRTLTADVTAGTSATVLWDGLVNGVRVPAGQTISYSFVNRGVAVNFPLYDAEGNEGGFVVRNVRPSSTGTDLLYWDDTNLTGFPTPTVQTTGTNAANAGHPWGNGTNTVGNNYLVNSWTYGFVSTASNLSYTTVSVCDNDNDGVTDNTDIDDDNDGVLDVVEALSTNTTSIDPSGFADAQSPIRYLDVDYVHPVLGAFRDANKDGINDIFDIDLDGIPNHFDVDADGDGLPDAVEANGNNSTVSAPTYSFRKNLAGGGTKSSDYNTSLGKYMATDVSTAPSSVGSNGLPDAVKQTMTYSNTGTITAEDGVSKYTLTDNDADTFTANSQTVRNYNFLDFDSDNDGIDDGREAQATLTYVAPTGLDNDKDGLDNAYDATPGGTALVGTSLTYAVDTDADTKADMFDADSDNDNAANGAKSVLQQTADWSEGFDTNDNGRAGDEILAKARAFTVANTEKATYYPVGNTLAATAFLQDTDNDKIPNFLDTDSPYYHDANFNGLVDLYDPTYGGTPSTAPKNAAGTQYLFRSNAVAVPLPVELTVFEATAKKADAVLTWTTASEKNNDHFVVERSINSTTFVAVGTVRGQGSTTRATEYRFTDAGVGPLTQGVAYYRLKQVDADGTASYGPIRKVVFGIGKAAVSLYPNPSQENATLDLSGLAAGSYQVQVVDLAGRVLRKQQMEAVAASLDLQGLPQGAYIVQVQGAGISQALPLIRR